ncbi:hypothetical protein GYMLUDRAFT_66712 [Collybiopsis luxurians FD-317 M1]|nr:hypothetical protein GYMLUDRAFT_66712 [Collybiopsis luxurians FD-317 M1]
MDSNLNLTLCSPRPSVASSKSRPKSVLVSSSVPSQGKLERGNIVLKVDKFGWSANNVTYQALGEHPHFRYYDFHPVPPNSSVDSGSSVSVSGSVSSQTHGLVPVWGFGTVVASAHPKVSVGERLYGYFVPARYLVLPIDEKDANKYSIYVPRPHLPADRRVYNQIQRCATDPLYSPETEDLTMLYRPLFWTSYWCEDWLARSNYRGGCEYILISSASSKTAFCFAYCIRRQRSSASSTASNTVQIIGLTSKGNMKFTKNLGLYDEVYDYDSFLSAEGKNNTKSPRWIYIDVAGNPSLNSRIYTHFASPYTFPKLIAAVSLGMTNLAPGEKNAEKIEWSTDTSGGSSSSSETASSLGFWPVAEQFFLPEWLAVRRLQLTPTQMLDMQKTAWADLMRDCTSWVRLEYVWGGERVKDVYEAMVENKSGLGPDKGWIWSMWNENWDGNDRVVKAKL